MPKKRKKKNVEEKIIRNGELRPKKGTITRAVWDMADRVSLEILDIARRGHVIERCREIGIKYITASNQYERWRRHNGLSDAPSMQKYKNKNNEEQ